MAFNNRNNRSEGLINLTQMGVPEDQLGQVAAMLVGQAGSGIKRYTKAANGSFVKLYNTAKGKDSKAHLNDCDTVYISARSDVDVRTIAGMISQDIQAFFDPSVKSTRPSLEVDCPSEAVGTIIGKRGESLKRLMRHIGEGCYIVHNSNSGKFEVTADNQNACLRTEQKIKDSIRDFYEDQKQYKRNQRNAGRAGDGKKGDAQSQNSFAGLVCDSDGESSGDDVEREVERSRRQKAKEDKLRRELFREDTSSYGATSKDDTRYRWQVREELSDRQDPETGGPMYPDYTARDHKTGKMRKFTGIHAVPWEAVDEEVDRRKEIGRRQADERDQARLARQDEKARQLYEQEQLAAMSETSSSSQPSHGWGDLSKVKNSEGVDELKEQEKARRQSNKPLPKKTEQKVEQPKSGMVFLSVGKVKKPKPAAAPVDLTPSLVRTDSAPLTIPYEPEEFLPLDDLDELTSPVAPTERRDWWGSDEE